MSPPLFIHAIVMIKLFFKDFRKKYGPWWGRFSSTIAATVCGITLTFGLTYWKTLNEKEKLLRTSEVWAMFTINEQLDVLGVEFKDIKEQIEVIKSVNEYKRKNTLDQCPDSLLSNFTAIFKQDNPDVEDNMSEMPFRNMELLRKADDIQVIGDIYILYKVTEIVDKIYGSWIQKICAIGNKHVPTILASGTPKADMEIANAILQDKDAVYFLINNLPSAVERYEASVNAIKDKYFKKELKRLNITEEEMDEFQTSLFDEDEDEDADKDE